MQSNNARKIIILAITIVAILLIVNVGLIIRINQLSREKNNLTQTISSQEKTISAYESSSSSSIDETATTEQE